jgi:uncharacterized cupredoxin-like copper-binding protein
VQLTITSRAIDEEKVMPYIVVVNHKSKGAIRIQTDVAHKENGIAQAKMRNPEPGDDWEGATVEERPAELDAAEKTVIEAGGVATEVCYRHDGRMKISFVIPGHNGEHTFAKDRQESLATLHDFVRSKIPRVIAIPRTK